MVKGNARSFSSAYLLASDASYKIRRIILRSFERRRMGSYGEWTYCIADDKSSAFCKVVH
jgi:hypothetical protein